MKRPGQAALPAGALFTAAAITAAGCTSSHPPARAAAQSAPAVPVTTAPAWCMAYEPDQSGQAAVAGAFGMTCHQLLALLTDATRRAWSSTQATDGTDWPRIAKLQRGGVTIRLWQGNNSGAAQTAANELHARGWAAVPGQ